MAVWVIETTEMAVWIMMIATEEMKAKKKKKKEKKRKNIKERAEKKGKECGTTPTH
jgi:hypothetical protein